MRQFILTQNNNNLHYMASTPTSGFAFPANEFVDLAIAYKDCFHKPMVGKNLVWQLVEGEATLQRQTTETDSDGNGTNSVQVVLTDPTANATIRLAVWPEDEPDSKLEFECLFGAPKAAPPFGTENILQTIYPQNDPDGRWPVHIGLNGYNHVFFRILCSDGAGNPIEKKDIEFTLKCSIAGQDQIITNHILSGNDYLNTLDFDPNRINTQKAHINNKSDGFPEFNSDFHFEDDSLASIYASNFWPPSGSVLQPGITYPLRAFLGMGGSGHAVGGCKLYWTAADDVSADNILAISPSSNSTDDNSVATASIRCNYVEFGRSDKVHLKVSGDYPEGEYRYDYPTFTIGGPRFVSIKPQPDDAIYEASKSCLFSVTVQDENGYPPAEEFDIAWEASMQGEGNAYFQITPTSLNDSGRAESTVFFKGVPQGKVQNFDVTITPSVGSPYKATYKVAANKITQVSPDPVATVLTHTWIPIKVRLDDYKGNPLGARKLLVAPNDSISLGDRYPVTDWDGIATIWVNSASRLNTNLSVSEASNCTPTTVELTFVDKPGITITTPNPATILYDADLLLRVTYIGTDGEPVQHASVDMIFTGVDGQPAPHLHADTSAVTNSNGEGTFQLYYTTTDGPAVLNTVIRATASANNGALVSETVELTFIGESWENNLTLVSPTDSSSHNTGEKIPIKLSLTNSHKEPLANYAIDWGWPSDGIQVQTWDPKTNQQGEANAVIIVTSGGWYDFKPDAPDAHAPLSFKLQIIEDGSTATTYISYDTNYAHNPPADSSNVNVLEDDQIVTLTFHYEKDGKPQAGKSIRWKIRPMVIQLQFFDENNGDVDDDDYDDIYLKTDQNGRCVLKVGCLMPFLGTASAAPVDDTSVGYSSPVQFAVVTFDPGTFSDALDPITFSNPISIPDNQTPGDLGFRLWVEPKDFFNSRQEIVLWVKSQPTSGVKQEHIRIVSVQDAINGITLPYTYLTPDDDSQKNKYNKFSYMLANLSDPTPALAEWIVPDVIGKRLLNHPGDHPGVLLKRPLFINNPTDLYTNEIINGINIYIPYDADICKVGKTINLILYLNKADGSFGNNFVIPLLIKSTDVPPTDRHGIAIKIQQDQLMGYDNGTLEADYYIDDTWSSPLRPIILHTAE